MDFILARTNMHQGPNNVGAMNILTRVDRVVGRLMQVAIREARNMMIVHTYNLEESN